MTDASFSQLNPMVGQSQVGRACVASLSGRYRVTATGSGAGGAFLLDAGAGLTLPYAVEWGDSAVASTGISLTPGVPLTGQTTTFLNLCALGGASSTMIFRLAASDLQASVSGVSYSGSVTLLIAPE